MMVLYENHQRAKRARLSALAAVVWAFGWFCWAYVLGSGGAQTGIVGLVVGVGVLPLVVLYFYGSSYVVRVSRDGDEVTITTLGLIGPRDLHVPVSEISDVAKPQSDGVVIRVAGRSMPLLLDLQAERVNIDAITALHPGGAPT